MKKSILICGLLIMLILTGCGDKKPKGMNDDDYKISLKVYETLNDYIDGSISTKEARETLNDLTDRFTGKDPNTGIIKTSAELSAHNMLKSDSMEKIKSERDDIKKVLNK